MKSANLSFFNSPHSKILLAIRIIVVLLAAGVIGVLAYRNYLSRQELDSLQTTHTSTNQELIAVSSQLSETQKNLTDLQTIDQIKRNDALEKEITDLQKGFKEASTAYDELLKLTDESGKKSSMSAQLTGILTLLSQRKYDEAMSQTGKLRKSIQDETQRLAATTPQLVANITKTNTPPGNGYQRQAVESSVGTFQVDVIAADLNSTKVVFETASAGNCPDGCPVASLADFVARAGGYAGINGPYFCPAEYPSCAGKTNSFDTLAMNRHKTYFNSDNNVHSVVPAYVFSGGSARLVGRSADVGRDTSVDAVIAGQPMLLSGGEVRFGGDGDPKKGSRGSRSFIGNKGSTVYIGVVRTATVAEVGHVLKAMGMENGLNLDSGGSTALYTGGKYVAGPGRQTPFGIVLVRK